MLTQRFSQSAIITPGDSAPGGAAFHNEFALASKLRSFMAEKEESTARLPSARHRRAMSAVQRPRTAARPFTASSRPRRPYSAYTQRGGDEDTPKFVEEATKREWWRFYLKDTPVPGSYRIGSFLEDLHQKPSSYHFRDGSRSKASSHQKFEPTGATLMPGAYDTEDFVSQATKKQVTFGFKAIDREQGPKIGHGCGDKELHTSPAWYSVADYSEGLDERGVKTSSYKSRVPRKISSAHQFRIVEGPGPGKYDTLGGRKPAETSSSFKSAVPRFHARPSRVPGPGSYAWSESVFGQPKPVPAAVQHMKKKHGISVS